MQMDLLHTFLLAGITGPRTIFFLVLGTSSKPCGVPTTTAMIAIDEFPPQIWMDEIYTHRFVPQLSHGYLISYGLTF